MNVPLRWYLTSSAFVLIPGGIQAVLFPWFVAVYLHESPAKVGFAQMAGQLPMLALILVGGLIGDRVDQRRLLIRLHLLMIVPPLLMATVVYAGLLAYPLLICWALVGGVLGAFAQPTRDALLSRVAGNGIAGNGIAGNGVAGNEIAGHDIQRVVMLATAVQFGVQILGFAVGSMADRVGPIPLMLVQAASMGLCVLATQRLPSFGAHDLGGHDVGAHDVDAHVVDAHDARAPVMPSASTSISALPTVSTAPSVRSLLRDIGEGLSIAWHSREIRPALALIFATGLFFAGTYMVVLPLMVRDIYHGGATGIALSFALNMLGTVCTIFVLMRRGGLERPGRGLLLAGSISCCVLLAMHFPLPMWGFYLDTFIWGMCGGISMTMGRSIVQEAAPASHRARVMSVYSLGMMGGMPIGSAVLGWCVGQFGARDTVLVSVIGMASVLLLVRLTTQLWVAQRATPHSAAEAPQATSDSQQQVGALAPARS